MASKPVTPSPKSNEDRLHDPFTDEKNGDASSAEGKGKADGNGGRDRKEEENELATPTLFYSYARRVCCPLYFLIYIHLGHRIATICHLGLTLEHPEPLAKQLRNSQIITGHLAT